MSNIKKDLILCFLLEKYCDNNNYDFTTLYNKLKELRFEYAKKLKLPAYVIFPDKTLIEMAKFKPTNSEELEKIFGVGKAKLKKFGKQFITAINTN